MTRQEIEDEVRRLSPWYYLYDLDGVRTDITPPCDQWGHRTVRIGPEVGTFLPGRTVLDVGCNEGGYSFAALEWGAAKVVGFDCRSVNVEKARLVARVRGLEAQAEFHVGSADTWPADQSYDVVFLCGLLYHLTEPWSTIGRYCGVARDGVYVTTMLAGGSDGYTPRAEGEGIAASEDPRVRSMTPNTVATLVREFGRHGFEPSSVYEERFLPPSAFRFLGRPLARKANRLRTALLNGLGPLYLDRRRGYLRRYVELERDVQAAGDAGGAGLVFRRHGPKAA